MELRLDTDLGWMEVVQSNFGIFICLKELLDILGRVTTTLPLLCL